MHSVLRITLLGLLVMISHVTFAGTPALAGSAGDLKPRVPPEQLPEAKSLKNPYPITDDLINKGKALFQGESLCYVCHGREGAGGQGRHKAPLNAKMPTNFADSAWQNSRTDGELFWILKHGSHGTDMAPYMPLFITEEEAWAIVAYLRTFGET